MAYLREHRQYLEDDVRNSAYDRALAALCTDKPTVLDLGAGTGLLGLMALRHGARRVYGVEATGLADFTASIAASNAGDDYVLLPGKSTHIDLPEPVDLVISDQLGAFILEGDPFPYLADAATRHLRPGGRVVPRTVEFVVSVSDSPTVRESLDFWTRRPGGFDMSALRPAAVGTVAYRKVDRDQLLAAPGSLGVLETVVPRSHVDLDASIVLDRPGLVNSIVGWFRAELAPGITISTEPGADDRIDRECVVLPLDPPLEADAGDRLEIRVRGIVGTMVLAWTITGPAGDERSHSSWQGFADGPIPR